MDNSHYSQRSGEVPEAFRLFWHLPGLLIELATDRRNRRAIADGPATPESERGEDPRGVPSAGWRDPEDGSILSHDFARVGWIGS